jgi:methyltransferase (TIGR00027 family)
MPVRWMTGWMVAIRTYIIDTYIRAVIAEDANLILNLGAGLDTRPYRMDLPKPLVWIEADYPDLIASKDKQLSGETPRCQLERAKIDLANLSERRRVFASVNARASKMLVLTEGVVPYLSVEDVGSLADDLGALDHLRYWIVDYFSPQIAKYRRRLMRGKMQNAPFKFEPGDRFGFFEEHGWRCKEIRYVAEEAQRLRRPIPWPLPLKLFARIRRLFASPAERAAFERFAGYALLEPESISSQGGG